MHPRPISALVSTLATAIALGGLTAPAHAAPSTRISWEGRSWYLSGANIPYFSWNCDFGCRKNGGVTAKASSIDRTFKRLSRNGAKVVRWYLFPANAWQVKRGAGDIPSGIWGSKVYPDLDTATALARKHDLYIVFVLFSDTRLIPTTWMTDASQRAALAGSLGPLFKRYGTRKEILAWEIFHEPERGIDDGTVAAADVQATVQLLASRAHLRSRARVTSGSVGVDRLDLWTGLGLDYFSASWFSSNSAGAACAGCTTPSTLASTEGIGKPVVVNGTDAPATTTAYNRLKSLRKRGYAGTFLWSVARRSHPDIPGGAKPSVPLRATWGFIYNFPATGPYSRLLNPCLGPRAYTFRCPDLRMGTPSNLFLSRRGNRIRLLSRNSIDSMGKGPAELLGRRNGRYTMRAVQRLWRRGSGKASLATGARLLFKAVPGQYRYWKWNGAATFELWRLDGAGRAVSLVRRGPKTVYCLRDLKRTHPSLKGSPRSMHYPGCNQSLSTQRVTLGTSVGWSDIYPSTYNENWIDVTGLRGCFAYVHIADPDNVVYELNEDNNRSQVVVRLPFTGSNRGCPGAKGLPESSGNDGY